MSDCGDCMCDGHDLSLMACESVFARGARPSELDRRFGPVDGLEGPTDAPKGSPTCDLIGCCDDGDGHCCYCGIEVER